MSGLQGGSAKIETWTEERFSASRADWQELLVRSDADPLFMSWDWQWRWWKHVGRRMGSELVLIAVLDGNSRLRALAPAVPPRAARNYSRLVGTLSLPRPLDQPRCFMPTTS